MGMYHSTSGKLGFTAHRVSTSRYPPAAPISRADMKAILEREDALRASPAYQAAVTATGHALDRESPRLHPRPS